MAKALINYQNECSLASRLRKKRMQSLLLLIEKLAAGSQNTPLRILDVGGTHLYWKMVPDGFLEKITTVRLNECPNCQTPLLTRLSELQSVVSI